MAGWIGGQQRQLSMERRLALNEMMIDASPGLMVVGALLVRPLVCPYSSWVAPPLLISTVPHGCFFLVIS